VVGVKREERADMKRVVMLLVVGLRVVVVRSGVVPRRSLVGVASAPGVVVPSLEVVFGL